jgi:hypothetical protein
MSTADETIDQVASTNGHTRTNGQAPTNGQTPTNGPSGGELDAEHTIALELCLSEAQALRAWLMKPTKDGANSLEDPLVSRVLANLARAVDSVQAAVNVRHELAQAGLDVERLTDDQVRELGRKVAEAASPGIRS